MLEIALRIAGEARAQGVESHRRFADQAEDAAVIDRHTRVLALPGELARCGAPVELAHATSKSPAAPMPPPMHIVTTTSFAPRRLPSMSAWPTRRAPLMP